MKIILKCKKQWFRGQQRLVSNSFWSASKTKMAPKLFRWSIPVKWKRGRSRNSSNEGIVKQWQRAQRGERSGNESMAIRNRLTVISCMKPLIQNSIPSFSQFLILSKAIFYWLSKRTTCFLLLYCPLYFSPLLLICLIICGFFFYIQVFPFHHFLLTNNTDILVQH